MSARALARTSRGTHGRRTAAGIVVAIALATGCGSNAEVVRGAADGEPRGELYVSAAASLTDVFAELAAAFEAQHEDVEVVLNLAGSRTLATQILDGAPIDVFVSADELQMDRVAADVGVATREVIARNHLVVAVADGNPRDVQELADLRRDDLVVVLPAPQVPAGALAVRLLQERDVDVAPASLEPDVRAALGRVVTGDADAALVYRSDVPADGPVDAIEVDRTSQLATAYPMAVLAEARNPVAAEAWRRFVASERGRDALAAAGFARP